MPEGWRPRRVTPCPRSGQQPRVPGCDSLGTADKSYPSPRAGVAAERSYATSKVKGFGRSYPVSEVRGSGREDQAHIKGAVAARVQDGLEELSHVEGQEGRCRGPAPADPGYSKRGRRR